ncbi:MAG: hypothetical protein ACJ8DC_05300 [Gemmatimonadales bacterium]
MRTLSTGPTRLVLVTIAAGLLIACRADTIAAPSDWPIAAKVVDQNLSASYGWHAGDAFTPPLVPPDVAEAANGDRIILTGTGTLTLHPKSVTGGGTFTHTAAEGTVLATGTFTATELLSFESYGPSPLLPPFLNSGQALIRVALLQDGSTTSIDGILRVECVLPGGTFPGGKEEGINLLLPGLANFNHQISGATVFVRID